MCACGREGVNTPVCVLVAGKVLTLLCGFFQEGGVFTFGAGMYGQLGHNASNSEALPKKVFELMGSEVSQLVCGRSVNNTNWVQANCVMSSS